jgi:hypothetical protein
MAKMLLMALLYCLRKKTMPSQITKTSHAHVPSVMLLVAIEIKTILDTCLLCKKKITQHPVKVEFHSIKKRVLKT